MLLHSFWVLNLFEFKCVCFEFEKSCKKVKIKTFPLPLLFLFGPNLFPARSSLLSFPFPCAGPILPQPAATAQAGPILSPVISPSSLSLKKSLPLTASQAPPARLILILPPPTASHLLHPRHSSSRARSVPQATRRRLNQRSNSIYKALAIQISSSMNAR